MRCTLPSNCTLAESALAAVLRYFVVRSLVNICRLIRPFFVRAVTRRGSYPLPSGLRCSLIFCCCVRRTCCASCRIIRLRAAGSRFASSAASHSSTLCRLSTLHRPHFLGFVRLRHRFNTRHTAVSTDQHTLRQLQVKADITDIVAQNIHLKGE